MFHARTVVGILSDLLGVEHFFTSASRESKTVFEVVKKTGVKNL